MKKYALLALSGSMLTLASCGGNENNTTQAQIDSTANARSAAMEMQMKTKNDSLINEMAKMRADSAMKASGTAMAPAPATGTAPTASTPARTHVKTHSSGSTNTKTTETNNTPTTPATTITKEQKQQQDNKFNER